MVHVNKYMYKTYYILIGLMIFLLPQAFILPIEYSYENHLLENTEVCILGIGLITMFYKMMKINIKKVKNFYLACGIFLYGYDCQRIEFWQSILSHWHR